MVFWFHGDMPWAKIHMAIQFIELKRRSHGGLRLEWFLKQLQGERFRKSHNSIRSSNLQMRELDIKKLYILWCMHACVNACMLTEFDREILTTVSTKGAVSGCSSIKPPATLSVTPSSIYHCNQNQNCKKDTSMQETHTHI